MTQRASLPVSKAASSLSDRTAPVRVRVVGVCPVGWLRALAEQADICSVKGVARIRAEART